MPKFSRTLIVSAFLSAACFAAEGAKAADQAGNFAVRGFGGRSCATFIADADQPQQVANYASWLMGYLSARNRLESNTFDIIPSLNGGDFLAIIAAVCRDQQNITLEDAASEVIDVIRPIHQQQESDIITIDVNGTSFQLRQSVIEMLQAALIANENYTGPNNGEWTEEFATAVREFQIGAGINPTGIPDINTIIRAVLFE